MKETKIAAGEDVIVELGQAVVMPVSGGNLQAPAVFDGADARIAGLPGEKLQIHEGNYKAGLLKSLFDLPGDGWIGNFFIVCQEKGFAQDNCKDLVPFKREKQFVRVCLYTAAGNYAQVLIVWFHEDIA